MLLGITGCSQEEILKYELKVTIAGDSIAIDENNSILFSADKDISPSSIYKYSIKGDQISKEDELWNAGSNGREVIVTSDNTKVILPCGGGNGDGYTVYAFDTTNLANVLGEWNIGVYPQTVAFNSDSSVLYGSNTDPNDNYLYVMDAQNYSEIRKLPLPNSDTSSVIEVNSNNSSVITFTFDYYYNSNYRLYFFDNIAN